MANCKDCFHFDVCMDYTSLKDSKFAQEFNETDILCDHFRPAANVIVPPVTVGQTVWFIRDYRHDAIIETTVEKIVVKHGGLYIKLACNAMYETSCKSIGKTVFLTRVEAEQALEDMRKE